MEVTFAKLLCAFSLAGLVRGGGYGGVGAGSGSFSSSSAATFSGSAGGAGEGFLGGLFGGEGKLGLGNLQFSASLGGKNGGLLGGGLFGIGSGGSFGFGGLGGGSADASKDVYGEPSVSFGGFGQGGSNRRGNGPSGGYGYGGGGYVGAATTGDTGGTYGEFTSLGGSGQSGSYKGGNGPSGGYENASKGSAINFGGASAGVGTFSQITGGVDDAEYRNSDASLPNLPKGNNESSRRGYGGHSTVVTGEFGGSGNCDSNIGCSRSEVYANDKIAVNSNDGEREHDSRFSNSGKAQAPAVFGSGEFVGSGSPFPGSANVGIGGSVSGGSYGKQRIQSGSGLPNLQDDTFLESGITIGGTVSGSQGNKEKPIVGNIGGNNAGGGSYSGTTPGLQFGAEITAEIEKGPKPQIGNVFLQNSENGAFVTSEFEGRGPGVFVTGSKQCSGSYCSERRVNGDGKTKEVTGDGGEGYGKQHIQSGSGLPNLQGDTFLESGITIGGTVSGSQGNKEKSIEGNIGGNNAGGGSYSGTTPGLQFGAEIAAEIEKGPKPQIGNVFLQNSENGALVTSEFEGRGPGVFVTGSKQCSGSYCSERRVNGDGKTKEVTGDGGEGYGKQHIQSGSGLPNLQGDTFLESGITIGGTVSGSQGNKEKPIEGNIGGNNAGGGSYSGTTPGLQFGAEIAAEIEKGPKPQIGNVFLQNSENGALVTSEFEGRGPGVFVTGSKQCSGSYCSQRGVNGDGKTKEVTGGGGEGYGKQHIQSGSGLPNLQGDTFLDSGITIGGTVSGSQGNKEKSIEGNIGGNNAGGGSYSGTTPGLQFGAEIAAEIEKGPKPQIGNVFLQNSENGALVTSEFEGRGPGVFVTGSKQCSGSYCSQRGVNGDGKTKEVTGGGGEGYGKQHIQSGSGLPNLQGDTFLDSGITIGGTVSGSQGNKEKPIVGNIGGNNAGGGSYSGTTPGLQFGAEIAAEIEKGPKPQIGNVFLQNSENGAFVTSEFEGRGPGVFVTGSKQCSGSSCSQGWANGDGKTEGAAAGGIAGLSTLSFSGPGNVDGGKSIEREGPFIYTSTSGIARENLGLRRGNGHGNGRKHHHHGHGKKHKVITAADIDGEIAGGFHGAPGFGGESSINADSSTGFHFNFGSTGNIGGGLFDILGGGGGDATDGRGNGAEINGSQAGVFGGSSKPCGGYDCGGQGGSEKKSIGISAAGSSSFASGSSGTGSYGYGR